MNRGRIASFAALLTLVSAIALHSTHAATPTGGTLTPTRTRLEWSGGLLNGTAPAQRNTVCTGFNCDDFMLDIRVPATAFKAPRVPRVVITLKTSAPNDIRLIVSRPDAADGTGSTDYTVYGTVAEILSPQPGVWRVRAACYACAAASYTATAVLQGYLPPALEPTGAFKWFNSTIPGPGAGEPGIAVDKQGRIFINAPLDGDTGGGSVWRSTDKGKTWTVKQGIDDPGLSGDTDLAIAPDDGTVYFMNLAYGPFSNNVYTSRDHGQTYTGPAIAGIDSDRQWFTAAPSGRVYVTYHDLASAASQMWVMRSDDYGKTFLPVGNVALGAASMVDSWCGNHQAGRPQVNPKNPDEYYIFYSIAPYADCATAPPAGADHELSEVWIARSADAGRTFTHTKVFASDSNTDHNLMGLDVDTAGNLYIVIAESNGADLRVSDGPINRAAGPGEVREAAGFAERTAANVGIGPGEKELSTHVKLFVSKDKGATWSKPILVDQLKDHHSNVFAAVAAGDPGRVNVAWYTSRAGSFEDAGATWTIAMAQSTNALAAKPKFAQSRASSGIVHTGPICQAGLGCTVTGANRNLLDFMAIDVGPDGMAYLTWAADTTGEVKVQFARQTAGPSAFAPKKLSTRR